MLYAFLEVWVAYCILARMVCQNNPMIRLKNVFRPRPEKNTNQYFWFFLGFSILGILIFQYFLVFSVIFKLRFGFLAIFYVGRTILDRFSPENTPWRRISGPKHLLIRTVFNRTMGFVCCFVVCPRN